MFQHGATDRVMAVFNAYFDESGTHEPRLLTIAGYIATDKQWAEFAREWGDLLRAEGIGKPFHMREFESPYGDYTEEKGWPKERRVNLQSRLIGIINRRVNIGIYATLDVLAYEELVTGWRREEKGSPYNFCVSMCLAQVSLWAQRFNRQDPIAYVIEHGAGYNHEVENAFRATFRDEVRRQLFRLGSLAFETKERAVELQAADMLAYEVWKDEYNFRVLPPEERRRRRTSYEALKAHPLMGFYMGRDELEHGVSMEEADFVRHLPEGTIIFRKPTINDVNITADAAEVEGLLDELTGLMELFPHEVYALVNTSASFAQAVRVDTDNGPTTTTCDLRVLFKPTDSLLAFASALRARKREQGVGE